MEEPLGRMIRVNKLLHQALADLLRKYWAQESVAITITEVNCSPDLYHAFVSYSVINDDKTAAVEFFRKNNSMISHALSKEVTLKRHPKLHFKYDDSLKKMADVDRILREIETESLPKPVVGAKKKTTKRNSQISKAEKRKSKE